MGEKLVIGLIGLFIGGIGGFFVGGAMCAREYKKTIERLQCENENLIEESKKAAEKAVSDREKAVQKAEVKYHIDEIIRKEGYSRGDGDEAADEGEEDGEEEIDDPFDESDEPKEPKGFRILTEEEYGDDSKYLESESLMYYQEDNVLADAFDEKINNPTNVVGASALKVAESTQEKFIYVSDDDEEKLYEIEIIRNESFYRDAVK